MDPLSITASLLAILDIVGKILFTCIEYGFAFKNASKVLSRIFEEVKSIRGVLESLQPLESKFENADSLTCTHLPALRKEPLDICLEELRVLEQKLALPNVNGQPGPIKKALLIQALCLKLKEKDVEKSLAVIGRSLNLAFAVDQHINKYLFPSSECRNALEVADFCLSTRLSTIEDLVRKTQDASFSLEKGFSDLRASFLSNRGITAPNCPRTDFDEQSTDCLDEDKLHLWLSAPDPSSNHHRALEQRQQGTGIWLENRQEFIEWKSSPKSSLWLYGKPGRGKSILASSIIEYLKAHCRRRTETAVVFFYFDFADGEKRDCGNMIRSLIRQLCPPNVDVPQALTLLYSSCNDGTTQPRLESLLSVLREIIQQFQEVYIVLDALDECGECEKLLEVIERVIGWEIDGAHVLLTSRQEHNIERRMENICKEQDRVGVRGEEVQNDISIYVHSEIQTDPNLKQWQKYPGLQEEIEQTLIKKADDMFRWVSCQLHSLRTCHSPRSVRQALKSLPRTLDETYARILCNVKEDESQYALRILHWLTHSIRPISLAELAEAVVVDVNEKPRFDIENRLFQPECILIICSSLITVESTTKTSSRTGKSVMVKLAHCSVKEYLVSSRILNGPAKAYGIRAGDANACIAEICLAYLLQFHQPDRITSQTPEDFPLALYAAECWIHHVWLADSETSTYRSLTVELIARGKEAFFSWVRLCEIHRLQNLNLIRSLDSVCPPLHCKSTIGLFKPRKLLLQRRAELYALGGRYTSAVDVVSRFDHHKVVEVLCDKRAGTNAIKYHDPMVLGMGYFFDDVMRFLFDEANEMSARWRQPLDVACFMKNHKAMQLLLDNRVSFNIQSEQLDSALGSAVCAGETQMVLILLDNGANINARFKLYGNPLQMATYWDREEVARLLIDRGADINAIGGGYGNALAAASCEGPEDLVRLLLERGADVNAHDEGYGNALHTAVFFGSENVIRLLLKYGADVNDRRGYYGTPISAAIWLERKEVVQLLYDNGADISSLNEEALNKAAFLFGFERWPESYMMRKLRSMLNGDLHATACELHHKMVTVDRNRCCPATTLLPAFEPTF